MISPISDYFFIFDPINKLTPGPSLFKKRGELKAFFTPSLKKKRGGEGVSFLTSHSKLKLLFHDMDTYTDRP